MGLKWDLFFLAYVTVVKVSANEVTVYYSELFSCCLANNVI